ncbi:putative PEGA domain protein [uncultured spirochete]|jgi:hypothetical protein|uniref:Putative PEGA domain protein n=1 Tax=uncultured spirochete TaxID=156406 RepID=A0A3P3XF31_9SPIR|nr:SUMF1/EgtB/PvdO family nonheme iron enzyme [Rectinema subterraneum]SLM09825.1 putative PEGA domain protein [uncultured spirochete]
MKDADKITEQEIAQAKVTLKPVLGVRPRVYVPVLYSIAILVVLFFLLVNPGLSHPGARLQFSGHPDAAAVYIDGAYAGNTQDGAHAKPGPHQIEIRKQGFSSKVLQTTVPNRIFATLIFPPAVHLGYALEPQSQEAIMLPAFKDFASWALSGKPSAIYQLPMTLSEASRDLASIQNIDRAALSDALLAAGISLSMNAASLRDTVYASTAIAAPAGSPLGVLCTARNLAGMLASSKNSAAMVMETIPDKASDAIRNAAAALKQETAALRINPLQANGLRSVGPHSFIMFKGGLLDLVSSTPEGSKTLFQSTLPEFGLASTEVTQREFARFLAENPDWKPENKAVLIEKGLADSSYLKDFDLAAADNRPITGVSWYAANAYCQWLNRQAPAGYEVVLPTEAMWEAAAAVSSRSISSLGIFKNHASTGPLPVGSAGTDSLSFSDLFGNVWEWTSDGFRPYAWIQKDSSAFDELIGAISQKTVKGGSWANSPDQISIDSRGPVPAAHGSEFLGFRPALRKK